MKAINEATAQKVRSFQPYGSGEPIVSHQYAYSDTHMFAMIGEHHYLAEIDEEARNALDNMHYNDFIGPAGIFEEAAPGLIAYETMRREEIVRRIARGAEPYDE